MVVVCILKPWVRLTLNLTDEEESDPDDEAPTRANIKKQAQQIIDQRNKKTRGGIKKKKKM